MKVTCTDGGGGNTEIPTSPPPIEEEQVSNEYEILDPFQLGTLLISYLLPSEKKSRHIPGNLPRAEKEMISFRAENADLYLLFSLIFLVSLVHKWHLVPEL